MIDTHCHLNFHAFKDDVENVIKETQTAGVTTIINTGTKLDSSQSAVDLAKQYDNLYAIVGIHPHHADKLENGWEETLKHIAKQEKVVAIGEIGLDYFSYRSNGIADPKVQKKVFEAQVQLAHELKLPLQIHNRLAGKDILEILHHHRNLLQTIPGMFHCFAGSIEILKEILDLGFYVGFDGNLTYPGLAPEETTMLSELAKATPPDRIVTETDSPYLTPIPHRGERNTPAYISLIVEEIARIKNIPVEEIAEQTTENAKRLFSL